MGLDMYLHKKSYIGNNYKTEDKRVKLVIPEDLINAGFDVKEERILEIVEQVAYWRKVNHIHQWFVDNVQGGEDDCKEYYVDKEQLRELIDVCQKVLINPDLKEDYLPTASGFFFGSTEYDEMYFRDIKDTIDQLKPLLDENGYFYYQASW